jgi:hypothetical protein
VKCLQAGKVARGREIWEHLAAVLGTESNSIRTKNHIGLSSSFTQELGIIEVSFDGTDMGVRLLQLCGRRLLPYEHGYGQLWVSFGDRVEEITANVASCTGPDSNS